MEESAEDDPSDDPIVIIDDDEEAAEPAAPAPKRRRWIWVAAPGVLLMVVLGTLALRPARPPAVPEARPAMEIAVAPETPPPLLEDPPEVQPEIPAPPAEAPPPPPREETVAKAPPPAPPPEPESKPEPPPSFVRELDAAACAIREAEPIFRDIADEIERGDPRHLAARMDRVEEQLRTARELYARLRNQVPDPETIEARLEILDELIEALNEGRERIRVPLALKEAELLQQQGRLREARDLYASVRNAAPDKKAVDRRIKRIDAQLKAREAKSAR
jgi:hypothetical protein